MLSDDLVKHLKSENELLQLQLHDLEYMISAREEELEILRKTAAQTVQLQSRLDHNLQEMEQMQSRISEEQRLAASASRREASLEEEMIQSLQMERDYYEIRDQFSSTQTALADLNNQMAEAIALYKQVSDLKARVAELESNLEIASLDNRFLKEELDKFREEVVASEKSA